LSTHEAMRDLEEQMTALENSHGPDAPPGAPRPESAPVEPDLPLPIGTQPMLEAHLGEALKIMRDLSAWVHHPHSGIGDCIRVSDAVGRMMSASAMLATVAARLQKGEPESRHRMIVEYAAPNTTEGERPAKSRKRINRGHG
jgi:hypothetical protein